MINRLDVNSHPKTTTLHRTRIMLVLTRKVGEFIFIGEDIEVIVTRIEPNSIRIAISAPKDIPVFRKELLGEATLPLPSAFPLESHS